MAEFKAAEKEAKALLSQERKRAKAEKQELREASQAEKQELLEASLPSTPSKAGKRGPEGAGEGEDAVPDTSGDYEMALALAETGPGTWSWTLRH